MQGPTPALRRVLGRLVACREVRGDYSEWSVEVPEGPAVAVAFASLCGPLRAGQEVWLNTTAVALGLGTGGQHFVIGSVDGAGSGGDFPGRGAGHILKLRYTPLQHRVLCVEDEASPHRALMESFSTLKGLPVVVAELHSQGAAAAIAVHRARPRKRIVWLHVDAGALPLAQSRLVARLREDGVLAATITAGQAFGGDFEAVSIHSALAAARAVARADVVIAAQGPGNAGTGTRLGFSGLALAEVLHAADALRGIPILALRMSEADPRERHRGVSHHSETLLRLTRVPVTVPLPHRASNLVRLHRYPVVDADEGLAALVPYRDMLTTMGRTLEQDPLFFRAAAAAGWWAATEAGRRPGRAGRAR